MNELELYKKIKKEYRYGLYGLIYKHICYLSVDAYISDATDEEYEVIANACINAYLKDDECDLIELADCVCEKYSRNLIDLDNLKTMSKWEIIELLY